MPIRHVLCITIDGLRASALGAYGNTWHPTPALDLLASQSQVFDWMLCDRPTLEGFYASVWQGDGASLVDQLTVVGVQAALTTDDRTVADRAEATGFAEIRRIEFTSEQSAASVAETELAQLFAVAVDQLEGWAIAENALDAFTAPRMLWLHARGFHGAWDAPLEFRESLLDDEDPPAPTFVAPPALKTVADHDALLLQRVAYAAQTMVLDECVGALLAALVEFGLDDSTLVILTGSRGYALGEHGVVGGGGIYGEMLHVPCLVRAPELVGSPPRSSALSQPVDLRATLLEWFGVSALGSPTPAPGLLADGGGGPSIVRQYVIATGDDGGRVIRTPAWMLYQRPSDPAQLADRSGGGGVIELYLKPDDRWEANEIADRCPEIVVQLLAALDRVTEAAEAKTPAIAEPLDEQLVSHRR